MNAKLIMRSNDHSLIPEPAAQRGREHGQGAAIVSAEQRLLLVDSRRSDRGAAHDFTRGPEQEMRQRNQVHSTIQEGSAALPRIEEPAVRIESGGVAEVGRQQTDLAQLARSHDAANLKQQKMESHPHCFHAKAPRLTSQVDHVASLGGGAGKRLLTEQGPPGGQAGQTMFPVPIVRARDVHDVQVVITGEALHGVMDATSPEQSREFLGVLRPARRNRGQIGAGHQAQILGKRPGHDPGSQDSPPDDRRGSSGVQEASSPSRRRSGQNKGSIGSNVVVTL